MPEITEVELTVPQGTTFIYEVEFLDKGTGQPINMTGWTSLLKAKQSIDDTTAVFTATDQDYITLGNGLATLRIPDSVTAAFTFSKVGFDWEVRDPAGATTVYRLVKGVWILDREYAR